MNFTAEAYNGDESFIIMYIHSDWDGAEKAAYGMMELLLKMSPNRPQDGWAIRNIRKGRTRYD